MLKWIGKRRSMAVELARYEHKDWNGQMRERNGLPPPRK
jgi:hypothetical protein